MWFRFHPPRPTDPTDGWIGDDIYLAVILFGIGGTAISVVGLTLLSLLVGEYTVSILACDVLWRYEAYLLTLHVATIMVIGECI